MDPRISPHESQYLLVQCYVHQKKKRQKKSKVQKPTKNERMDPRISPLDPNTSLYSVMFIRKRKDKKNQKFKNGKKRETGPPNLAPWIPKPLCTVFVHPKRKRQKNSKPQKPTKNERMDPRISHHESQYRLVQCLTKSILYIRDYRSINKYKNQY